MKIEWILCPFCGSKTRLKIRDDTILDNFPLYCPKCKHETLIAVLHLLTPQRKARIPFSIRRKILSVIHTCRGCTPKHTNGQETRDCF